MQDFVPKQLSDEHLYNKLHVHLNYEYKDNFYTIFILEMKLVISYYWYSPTYNYMTLGFLRIRSPPKNTPTPQWFGVGLPTAMLWS